MAFKTFSILLFVHSTFAIVAIWIFSLLREKKLTNLLIPPFLILWIAAEFKNSYTKSKTTSFMEVENDEDDEGYRRKKENKK